jgi:hypothetical protein
LSVILLGAFQAGLDEVEIRLGGADEIFLVVGCGIE